MSNTFLNCNYEKWTYQLRVVHVVQNIEQYFCRIYTLCIQKVKSEDILHHK